ncbi:MAG: M56 family metallopeptidase [Acutalibacter sp.]|jgi:beta-lactamase regulating signal transducer with metallopeptidase domain
MTVTPYSLMSAVMWSSVFIVLLYFFRKNTSLLAVLGATPLLLLGLGTGLRCLFPLMVPNYTRLVHLKGVFAALYRQTEKSLAPFPGTVGGLLCLLWVISILFLLAKETARYLRFRSKLQSYESLPDETITQLALQAAQKLGTPIPRLVQTVRVMSPMIVGFRHPTILLPNFPYTQEEYRLILIHELVHWKNRDLWVKFFVEIYCICFWWNPLVYFMRRDLSRTLELKCDAEVLKDKTPQEAKAYREALVKTLVFSQGKVGIECPLPSVGLISPIKRDLLQRVDLILRKRQKGFLQKAALWCASMLMVLLLAWSYSIVLAPDYHPPMKNFQVISGDSAEEEIPNFEDPTQE